MHEDGFDCMKKPAGGIEFRDPGGRRIEQAGRTCYKSEERATPDSAQRFVRMIIKRGHESVLEHVVGQKVMTE